MAVDDDKRSVFRCYLHQRVVIHRRPGTTQENPLEGVLEEVGDDQLLVRVHDSRLDGVPGEEVLGIALAGEARVTDWDMTSDDELVGALRDLMATVDPIPAAVLAAAQESRRLVAAGVGAEVAELTYDSLVDESSLRTVRALGVRQLTFEGPHLTVEIEVRAGDSLSPRHVVGQLVPAQAATIEVCMMERSFEIEANAMGRFETQHASGGPFSLRCRLADESVTGTEWVTI